MHISGARVGSPSRWHSGLGGCRGHRIRKKKVCSCDFGRGRGRTLQLPVVVFRTNGSSKHPSGQRQFRQAQLCRLAGSSNRLQSTGKSWRGSHRDYQLNCGAPPQRLKPSPKQLNSIHALEVFTAGHSPAERVIEMGDQESMLGIKLFVCPTYGLLHSPDKQYRASSIEDGKSSRISAIDGHRRSLTGRDGISDEG